MTPTVEVKIWGLFVIEARLPYVDTRLYEYTLVRIGRLTFEQKNWLQSIELFVGPYSEGNLILPLTEDVKNAIKPTRKNNYWLK